MDGLEGPEVDFRRDVAERRPGGDGAVDPWPDMGAFIEVARAMEVTPSGVLAVVRNEVEAGAASEAGMRVAAIPGGWTPASPPSAHFVLSGVLAVPALVRNLP